MDHKSRLLDALLRDESLGQVLIFTATKRSADELSIRLRDQGIAADALHGDMNQGSRNRTAGAAPGPPAGWWRPMSPPGGWTSPASATSSTSTCAAGRRTTCTASARTGRAQGRDGVSHQPCRASGQVADPRYPSASRRSRSPWTVSWGWSPARGSHGLLISTTAVPSPFTTKTVTETAVSRAPQRTVAPIRGRERREAGEIAAASNKRCSRRHSNPPSLPRRRSAGPTGLRRAASRPQRFGVSGERRTGENKSRRVISLPLRPPQRFR